MAGDSFGVGLVDEIHSIAELISQRFLLHSLVVPLDLHWGDAGAGLAGNNHGVGVGLCIYKGVAEQKFL